VNENLGMKEGISNSLIWGSTKPSLGFLEENWFQDLNSVTAVKSGGDRDVETRQTGEKATSGGLSRVGIHRGGAF